ncbi:MAG TPA: glycosyltransferase family 39 protein, partial [Ktedonobacteraceae bacterium]|nr:glycosyltransferase family 39 protein [Ktedonobacteraceae bacterium]
MRIKLRGHTYPPDRVPQGSPPLPVPQTGFPAPPPPLRMRFLHLAFANTWEIYLILLVAGFLRFYQIDTSEFDDDQAILFRMAHDAIYHGLLPITSNTASISIAHPPGVIYLFVLPAALSANPLWAVVFVGICNMIAVLLTYLFTRRYYGRLAGAVTAFLYATALKPLTYGRFIWQPNLMPPFVVFFIFALFWGVVERRKGWLVPALLLLGILYQMHETAILLLVPLLVAVVLAPGPMRWRDLAFAFVLLLIIYSPYLLWEFSTKFADLLTLYTLEKHGRLYLEGIGFYLFFISSYGTPPANIHSVVRMLAPLLSWLGVVMPLLAAGGFVTAGVVVMWSPYQATPAHPGRPQGITPTIHEETISLPQGATETPYQAAPAPPGRPQGIAPTIHEETFVQGATEVRSRSIVGATLAVALEAGWWSRLLVFLHCQWTSFRSTPYRCGLFLLLVWQIIPLTLLLLHKIGLTWHYFLILMPGPFIFMGLFVSTMIGWLRNHGQRWNILRYGTYVLISLLIVAQIVNCTASIVDTASGNFSDRDFPPYPYHNDLHSLLHALSEADQLAQQRHLNRVYITTDAATQTALRYLAEQMQTSTTLFDATNCLVLPNLATGPAVLLVGPYDGLTNALLSRFASATLIDQPMRLGGPPFRLYLVTPIAGQLSSQDSFVQNLQLLDGRVQHLTFDNSSWLVTRWSFIRSEQPRFRTTYNYALSVLPNGNSERSMQSLCTVTSMREGD